MPVIGTCWETGGDIIGCATGGCGAPDTGCGEYPAGGGGGVVSFLRTRSVSDSASGSACLRDGSTP
ncbi:hypothetical protein GCM10029992_30650 [Glycomyces albus]